MAGRGREPWGGLAQKAGLNGDWLIPLPNVYRCSGDGDRHGGYTAMLCIWRLSVMACACAGEVL